MSHPNTQAFNRPLLACLSIVAVFGLTACAAPYPMTQQPVYQAPAHVYAPSNPSQPDYRRRHNERLYEAEVLSVRAVMGQTEQRCWIEREAVPQQSGANVPGAIIGGVIGGILGHQVGGGSGRDLATAGGAVAGAVIGANVGRDRYGNPVTRDVQRCNNDPASSEPAYWDVTYRFRGITHHVQTMAAPGRTITVNADGEPREE